MNYHIFTLFPEMIEQGLNTSIIGKAIEKELIRLNLINIRDYANNKHNKVDDYPYGGGAGMLMQPEPIYSAYKAVVHQHKETYVNKKPRMVYLTPQGKTFNQEMAEEFAKESSLMFLCGHYEGVDERVLEEVVTDYVSIGDYVLTGGELAVMVMIDAISRLIPGVLSNKESTEYESFQDGLLEYPHYTRPYEFLGKTVPDVLLSGHHAHINKWRKEQSLLRTCERRPDLIEKASLSEDEKKFLKKHCKNL
ncbi:tRNA (guanine37-N1)-methyltransferase [Natranaerovirga hydrolytica]|uniref:tRNA (guanine-N(1)-)-methyltransferase n=1 Tax=Natranaerovirga hydrolytica TaxID=680378 RepID=A0A4R1N2R8_9FIRM|nr:tRNA (guanosine(37)-N1)-methyltransferase TrmD [Natranaerovirga hydrolytica]TCK98304.1 tRNA (guanine37-N1)-methyltransferase [Natranaerovirga hydrolytica]